MSLREWGRTPRLRLHQLKVADPCRRNCTPASFWCSSSCFLSPPSPPTFRTASATSNKVRLPSLTVRLRQGRLADRSCRRDRFRGRRYSRTRHRSFSSSSFSNSAPLPRPFWTVEATSLLCHDHQSPGSSCRQNATSSFSQSRGSANPTNVLSASRRLDLQARAIK